MTEIEQCVRLVEKHSNKPLKDLTEIYEDVEGCFNGEDLRFHSGDAFVVIYEASDGEGYIYDLYKSQEEYESDNAYSEDGGQCTGSLADSIEMAIS